MGLNELPQDSEKPLVRNVGTYFRNPGPTTAPPQKKGGFKEPSLRKTQSLVYIGLTQLYKPTLNPQPYKTL